MPPRARCDVVSQAVADDLVIYDPLSDRSHRLNRVAGEVWRLADARRSAADIAAEISSQGLACDEAVVELALLDLRAAGLLEPELDVEPKLSRRALLTLVGQGALAAMLLPIVASLEVSALPAKCFTNPLTQINRTPASFSDPDCTTTTTTTTSTTTTSTTTSSTTS